MSSNTLSPGVTTMNDYPSFICDAIFDQELKTAVESIPADPKRCKHVQQTYNAQQWNMGYGTICCAIKAEYADKIGVVRDNGYGSDAGGRVKVVGQVANIPVLGEDEALDTTDPNHVASVLDELTIDAFKPVGFVKGNYYDQDTPEKSPLTDGVPVVLWGPLTAGLKLDQEIHPFTDCTLAITSERKDNTLRRNPQKAAQFTIKPVDNTTTTQKVKMYLRDFIAKTDTEAKRDAAMTNNTETNNKTQKKDRIAATILFGLRKVYENMEKSSADGGDKFSNIIESNGLDNIIHAILDVKNENPVFCKVMRTIPSRNANSEIKNMDIWVSI